MVHRSLLAASALAGTLLFAGTAVAAPGSTTGNVNMRTGPGTQYGVITTIPAGAPVEVFGCQSWCQVAYAGSEGYVSGNYITTGYAPEPAPAPTAYYRSAPVYTAPLYTAPVYAAPPVVYWGHPGPYRYYRDPYWRYPRARSGVHFSFGF